MSDRAVAYCPGCTLPKCDSGCAYAADYPPVTPPPFAAGGKSVIFFALDSTGRWHFAAANGVWQTCANPIWRTPG
jgi:hypothetical protein